MTNLTEQIKRSADQLDRLYTMCENQCTRLIGQKRDLETEVTALEATVASRDEEIDGYRRRNRDLHEINKRLVGDHPDPVRVRAKVANLILAAQNWGIMRDHPSIDRYTRARDKAKRELLDLLGITEEEPTDATPDGDRVVVAAGDGDRSDGGDRLHPELRQALTEIRERLAWIANQLKTS